MPLTGRRGSPSRPALCTRTRRPCAGSQIPATCSSPSGTARRRGVGAERRLRSGMRRASGDRWFTSTSSRIASWCLGPLHDDQSGLAPADRAHAARRDRARRARPGRDARDLLPAAAAGGAQRVDAGRRRRQCARAERDRQAERRDQADPKRYGRQPLLVEDGRPLRHRRRGGGWVSGRPVAQHAGAARGRAASCSGAARVRASPEHRYDLSLDRGGAHGRSRRCSAPHPR